MGGIVNQMKDVFSKRELIFRLAISDFKKRFVGSYFGIFWMFVQPIVTIVIYYCVFQLGFKAMPPSEIDVPYVLWLVPAIVPWFYFNEAVSMGTGCLYDYNFLVKKVVFKVEVLPIIKNVSCIFVHIIFMMIMIAFFLVYGLHPNIYWIQIIYYTFCEFVLIVAITMMTSAVNVFFKDMSQIVNICLQFGMWVTPIMYDISMVGRFAKYFKLNPFYYISEGFRDSMLNGVGFWEHPALSVYFWTVTLVLFVLGMYVFRRMKPHFADVL